MKQTVAGVEKCKVLPVVVYRVYADARPDELVRGVDIVGTPLSCFSKIGATGDDPAVFKRSMSLRLGDLQPPYFVQYSIDDTSVHRLSAKYGALVSSTFSRARVVQSGTRGIVRI